MIYQKISNFRVSGGPPVVPRGGCFGTSISNLKLRLSKLIGYGIASRNIYDLEVIFFYTYEYIFILNLQATSF